MVVASSILAVGREKATIVGTFESHAEVIRLRVEGIARMIYLVFVGLRVNLGDIDVESAHAHMSVTTEVEVAVRSESRKHLVAWRIDRFAEVFHTTQSCGGDAHTPDVETTHATWHVRDKIEPFAIGRDSGMGIAAKGILRYF